MISDIKQYLEESGVSTPIFMGQIPDKPDNCLCLYRYAGKPPELEAKIEKPGLQVLSRAENYSTAKANIEQVAVFLCMIGDEFNDTLSEGVVINEKIYYRVSPVQSYFQDGVDGKGRYKLKQNFYVNKEM